MRKKYSPSMKNLLKRSSFFLYQWFYFLIWRLHMNLKGCLYGEIF